jgi:hypothetical protein
MPTQAHQLHLKFSAADGKPQVAATVEGINGPGCTTASAWLDGLGHVAQDLRTDAFYQSEAEPDADAQELAFA